MNITPNINTIYPILYKNFDLNDVKFSGMIYNAGQKIVFLYNKIIGKQFYIQTPEFIHNIDIQYNNNKDIYEMLIPLYNPENTDNINIFKKKMELLDDLIKQEAKINKNNWFENSKKNLNIKYKSIIRYIDITEYDDNLQKMLKNGILSFKMLPSIKVFFNNGENIVESSISEIPCNCYLKMIFEINGIWFSNEEIFGVYLKPILIEYKNIQMFKFIDEVSENNIYDTEVDDNNIKKKINSITNNSSYFNKSQIENKSLNFSISNNKKKLFNLPENINFSSSESIDNNVAINNDLKKSDDMFFSCLSNWKINKNLKNENELY